MRRTGHLDLEATEMAVREGMHRACGAVLERLLDADGGGHCAARVDCGAGHQAGFVGFRLKELATVLAPILVRRAYYHCPECAAGVIPKDRQLDIVGTSYSPGLRRMMGRVGAKEPFREGRCDLEELAGVRVSCKAVERVSESLGEQAEEVSRQERELALSGKVVPFSRRPAPTMYVCMDGTGVPVVPREGEGRQGKGEAERAGTREAKLGCVFDQTGLDGQGRPKRDEASTTYVAAIEAAGEFGGRIYAEAARRGAERADRVVVLGDGAPWIWGLADEHFPAATQIIDLLLGCTLSSAADFEQFCPLWIENKVIRKEEAEERRRKPPLVWRAFLRSRLWCRPCRPSGGWRCGGWRPCWRGRCRSTSGRP